jgi:nucleoside-diphosphate-sugar epimerase
MNILVTRVTGLIGSRLIRALVDEHDVRRLVHSGISKEVLDS